MLKYFSKQKHEPTAEEIEQKRKDDAAAEEKIARILAAGGHPDSQPPPVAESAPVDNNPTSAGSEQQHPVLSDEDELFLLHVASEGEPPPLPPRPDSTQPTSETKGEIDTSIEEIASDAPTPNPTPAAAPTWQSRMNEWFLIPQQDLTLQRLRQLAEARQVTAHQRQRSKDRTSTADSLAAAAESLKNRPATPEPEDPAVTAEKEQREEQQEVSNILTRLNLSSINNRVVGISSDTQKLLERFNQVLKDIVNGVPTAYDDLEKLLTDREGQLDKLYGTLPSWVQGIVKTVPVKVYAALAPQLAAAMTADAEAKKADEYDADGKKKKKKRFTIPSVKQMIGQKGMVAGMLRSIISFLEARFPLLLTGTNVIVSLAVFILLFVFWYCHKRGRETRLAKEIAEKEGLVMEEDSDDSLGDLEKGVDLESSKMLGDEVEAPRAKELKALPAADDKDIEQNVDVLMAQLGKPTEEEKADPAKAY